jgi:hypothetical protein
MGTLVLETRLDMIGEVFDKKRVEPQRVGGIERAFEGLESTTSTPSSRNDEAKRMREGRENRNSSRVCSTPLSVHNS